MTTAEIITIGTELLLGEIQDTNTVYLARQLRHLGIDLYRVTTVGDNPLRIADTIRESLSRADIIITTGGLGPTIDDPTRNAAAVAFNVDIIFHAELWEIINDRFQRRGISPTENNKKQAYLPANAVAIENPVGTAPAFYILKDHRILICLPGVPGEMETIFQTSVIPILNQFFRLAEVIKTRVLHTSGIGESVIDDAIADLETMNNPTVGLSAHPGNVDIRITAKFGSEMEADRMIKWVENEITQRLPDVIFGADGDSLPNVIKTLAQEKGRIVKFSLFGMSSDVFLETFPRNHEWLKLVVLDVPFSLEKRNHNKLASEAFAANFNKKDELATLELFYLNGDDHEIKVSTYNGPLAQAETWARNICLDFIWRKLRDI